MYKLRDYQLSAIDSVRKSAIHGKKKIILCLPTGSGKTIISIGIIQNALAKHKKVLFMAPRRELITQSAVKFAQSGIDCGILMAGHKYNPMSKVIVASVDTIQSRCIRGKLELPKVDVVIVDECHLYDTKKRGELINLFVERGAIVVGLTATPAHGNGKGLGRLYDDLIIPTSIGEMIEQGWLSKVRYYGGTAPDTANVKITAGDYNLKQLEEAANKKELNGSIVQNWLRIAKGKSTVVFCVSKAHSRAVCDEFINAGIKAEHYDCDTKDKDTQAILKRVDSGETTVLCNVYKATFGLDIPRLEVAVMARPTKSIPLYFQTCGRVIRPFEGKDHAIIIDHANCVDFHGFIDQEPPWKLDSSSKVSDERERKKKESKEPKEVTCTACGTIFKGQRDCPSCGAEIIPMTQPIPYYDFDLGEIGKQERGNNSRPWSYKENFYSGLVGYAEWKGYSHGWAAHKYKKKFGVWPNDKRLKKVKPKFPDPEVYNWILSGVIAYTKSKANWKGS